MTEWNPDDLASLASKSEVQVAGRRKDGSPRTLVTIWQVVVDDQVYVRSWHGADGQWYKGVMRHGEGFMSWDGDPAPVTYIPDASRDDEIDAAYVAKYGRNMYSDGMTNAQARATTLRVEPR
ncbi:DUF2255 family protein [Demequina zhanjiangensis]|uniref:DUF2255 family protein n=1 Tax=Demequina zhanjiangensis TaxID=3051659 RepID=A0ABT8FZV6_9MICO|nr:DUF2255 family protein [Demequina sp. SYSU T00b26]MDN4472418.1 DUF2255 family protein [Demequina sp. SYSU T00b26]